MYSLCLNYFCLILAVFISYLMMVKGKSVIYYKNALQMPDTRVFGSCYFIFGCLVTSCQMLIIIS